MEKLDTNIWIELHLRTHMVIVQCFLIFTKVNLREIYQASQQSLMKVLMVKYSPSEAICLEFVILIYFFRRLRNLK